MVGNNGISKNNKMILLSKYDYQPIFSLLNFSIERSDIPIRFKSSICTLSAIPVLLKQIALTLVLSVSSLPLCLLSSSTSAVHSTQHSSISAKHVLRSVPGFLRHSQKQSRRSAASPPPPCFGAVHQLRESRLVLVDLRSTAWRKSAAFCDMSAQRGSLDQSLRCLLRCYVRENREPNSGRRSQKSRWMSSR